MRKYRFAKFYLTGLLVAAILVAAIGALVGLYYGSESIQAIFRSQSLEKKPVLIDTASVFDAFQETTEILNKNHLVPSTQAIRFDREIQKGKPTHLSLKEIADFEVVITQMAASVSTFKQQCMSKIQANLEKIIAGSQSALPINTKSTNPTLLAYHKNATRPQLLFVDGVVSDTDIEILKQCGDFLKLQVRNYTPSTSAQTLAVKADADLRVLIAFLMNQLQALRDSREIITMPTSTQIAQVNPTEQEMRIREFLSYLQRIEEAVESVIAKEWVVDREMASARKTAQEARLNILREIADANRRAKECGKQMVIWVVISLVAALLLLVIRDFMSALIDTAANTGGMLDLLTPKDSDKPDET